MSCQQNKTVRYALVVLPPNVSVPDIHNDKVMTAELDPFPFSLLQTVTHKSMRSIISKFVDGGMTLPNMVQAQWRTAAQLAEMIKSNGWGPDDGSTAPHRQSQARITNPSTPSDSITLYMPDIGVARPYVATINNMYVNVLDVLSNVIRDGETMCLRPATLREFTDGCLEGGFVWIGETGLRVANTDDDRQVIEGGKRHYMKVRHSPNPFFIAEDVPSLTHELSAPVDNHVPVQYVNQACTYVASDGNHQQQPYPEDETDPVHISGFWGHHGVTRHDTYPPITQSQDHDHDLARRNTLSTVLTNYVTHDNKPLTIPPGFSAAHYQNHPFVLAQQQQTQREHTEQAVEVTVYELDESEPKSEPEQESDQESEHEDDGLEADLGIQIEWRTSLFDRQELRDGSVPDENEDQDPPLSLLQQPIGPAWGLTDPPQRFLSPFQQSTRPWGWNYDKAPSPSNLPIPFFYQKQKEGDMTLAKAATQALVKAATFNCPPVAIGGYSADPALWGTPKTWKGTNTWKGLNTWKGADTWADLNVPKQKSRFLHLFAKTADNQSDAPKRDCEFVNPGSDDVVPRSLLAAEEVHCATCSIPELNATTLDTLENLLKSDSDELDGVVPDDVEHDGDIDTVVDPEESEADTDESDAEEKDEDGSEDDTDEDDDDSTEREDSSDKEDNPFDDVNRRLLSESLQTVSPEDTDEDDEVDMEMNMEMHENSGLPTKTFNTQYPDLLSLISNDLKSSRPTSTRTSSSSSANSFVKVRCDDVAD